MIYLVNKYAPFECSGEVEIKGRIENWVKICRFYYHNKCSIFESVLDLLGLGPIDQIGMG